MRRWGRLPHIPMRAMWALRPPRHQARPWLASSISLKHTRTDMFKLLQLKTFDDQEIKESFQILQKAQPSIQKDNENGVKSVNIVKGLEHMHLNTSKESVGTWKKWLVAEKIVDTDLTLDQYKKYARELGEKLDRRIYSIATSFLFTGVSVGIVIPCMPLLISELQLPPSDMGMVVSAFGLAKLIANMPSAYLVDRHGRKPAIGSGLALCGLGIGAISLTLLPGFGSSWLIACRMLSGVGVSAFLAGGFMFVSDISTSLNRTRTIAPVMASFHAGSALGPAIGGVLVQHMGLAYTYATVGCLFMLNAVSNHWNMIETAPVLQDHKSATRSEPSGAGTKLKSTLSSWGDLLRNRPLRDIIAMNGAYWFVWSGAQLTLLPLFLVSNPAYSLSPAELGGFFAASSAVSFLSAQPVAYVADKYSKPAVFVTGLGLISACITVLPSTTSLMQLFTLLIPLSVGSTIVNALPTSIATDTTTETERAQALSLMRTAGDLGLLFGATTAGIVAAQSDLATAFVFDGTVLGAAMTWFGYRMYKSRHRKL